MSLSSYEILETLSESPRSLVRRARRRSDGALLVIKTPTQRLSAAEYLPRYRNEHAICSMFDAPGVLDVCELIETPHTVALVSRNYPGFTSLRERGTRSALDVRASLRLMLSLLDALAAVHAHNVIHADIKPDNILVDEALTQVVLIDFGIAAIVPRDIHSLPVNTQFIGTLGYMAPEQTGRINKHVDYRSDLHGVGATLHWMLSGKRPFADINEHAALVHAHIARVPPLLSDSYSHVPPVLARIVAKLLSKAAEDRYRGVFGLRRDLERCLATLDAGGHIPTFELATVDPAEHLQLGRRLYGRAPQLARLRAAIDEPQRSGPRLLVVAGASGSGKSTLISALREGLLETGVLHASGSFDQSSQHVPYTAISQALRGLLANLVDASGSEREAPVLERMREALGPNGGLLVDLVPEIVELLGPQPEVPPAGPGETRDRFLDTLTRFADALLGPERDIVLILDDAQWADRPSVRLLQSLCLASTTRLTLLLGARTDELVDDHPLTSMLAELDARDVPHERIELAPMTTADIEAMIVDVLDDAPESAALAELMFRRTQGTPLYVSQLLLALYDEGIIDIDRERGRWRVDVERAAARASSGDVIEFLAANLRKLGADAQQVLGVAACIGNPFELGTLAAACDQPLGELTKVVLDAVASGHLLPIATPGPVTKLGNGLAGTSTSGGSQAYMFAHARIQQVALASLSGERASLQLRIARRLLEHDNHDEQLQNIAGHVAAAIELIVDPDERRRFAKLCADAGARAKASTAYEAAAAHYSHALRLLGDDGPPSLRFDHTLELGECQFMAAQHDAAAATFERARTLVDSRLELLRLLMRQGILAMLPGDVERTLELLMEVAALFELDLRRGAGQDWLLGAMSSVLEQLGERGPAEIAALPLITDREQLLLSYQLLASSSAAYFDGDVVLYGGTALQLIRIALAHGISDVAAIGFIQAGLLTSAGGQYELTRRLSTIAFAVLERFPDSTLRWVGQLAYAPAAQTYLEPIHSAIAALEATHVGLRNGGMISMAGYAANLVPMIGMGCGLPLHSLHASAIAARDYLTSVGDLGLVRAAAGYADVAACLADPETTVDTLELSAPLPVAALNPTAEFSRNAAKAIACVFLRDSARAQHYVDTLEPYRMAGTGMYLTAVFDALMVVNDCDRWPSMSDQAREQLRARMPESLAAIERWQQSCPENARALHQLVRGAWAHAQAQHDEALAAFRLAADFAAEDGFAHLEGLANERGAELLLARGESRHAIGYLEHARAAYARWGARVCERRVHRRLRELIHLPDHDGERERTLGSTSSSHSLDVTSIIKMSQAMSASTRVEEVAGKLLALASENAGADRSVLLLDRGGGLELCAELRAGAHAQLFTRPRALTEAADALSLPIIRAAERRAEPLIVDDASRDARCRRDAYTLVTGLRSLCVVPIVKHGVHVGLLVLENHLIPGAFTREHLDVLAVLCAQAAITLDNAQLFDALRRSEEQWRSLVDSAPDSIMILDREHRVEFFNHRVINPRIVRGVKIEELAQESERERVSATIDHVFETGEYTAFDVSISTPNGRREVTTRLGPIMRDGVVERATLISTDVTKRRMLEEQLRQAQKMQAVGTLAGGVAHDFNNLLTIILGACELAEQELDEHHGARELLAEIGTAGRRASELTGQLLAFSRKQVLKPRLLDLGARVRDTAKMLTRLLGEHIHFELDTANEPCLVRVDPGQVEQVLVNLAVNARDAMRDGGTLTVRVRPAQEHELDSGRIERQPLVVLEVIDTGVGMSAELLERVFEPFFTTKQRGQGTGLGLPTVLGIIEQSGGYLDVDSEPGRGTHFRAFLPRVLGEALDEVSEQDPELPRGRETVLVVEDEPAVRALVCRVLELQGYVVLGADGHEQALELAAAHTRIDLLLTDVVLRGANGREVAEAVLRVHPRAKVLYTSGYTDDAIMRHGVLDGTTAFLQKPFTRESLALDVRRLLDDGSSGS